MRKTKTHSILGSSPDIADLMIFRMFGGPAQTRTEIPIFGGVDSIQLSYRATKLKAGVGIEPAYPRMRIVAACHSPSLPERRGERSHVLLAKFLLNLAIDFGGVLSKIRLDRAISRNG